MYRSSIQILLIATIVVAAAIAPVVRASVSCCAGDGDAVPSVVLPAPAGAELTGCGSCCASDDVGVPGETPSEPDHSDDPCGDDCGCTLCRVMSSATAAFVEGQSLTSFSRSIDPAFIELDHVFAREAAFGLLRPPQA